MTYDPRLFGFSSTSIPASKLSSVINNSTGITIPKYTPVRIDTSGNMALVDVSIEATALAIVGITTEDVLNGVTGNVSLNGQFLNIVMTASFGDIIYVAKDGSLTNIKPSDGVSGFVVGDFVIRIGVITKNEANPLLKDIFLNIGIVGQI